MANTIQLKRGAAAGLPTLAAGEPGFTTDTFKLYVGTAASGNKEVGAASFLPLAGGTMAGAIAMGTNKITGLGDPSAAQDAATKSYVDTLSSGLRDFKESVTCATTANLPAHTFNSGVMTASANGAFPAQDGFGVGLNYRILVKCEGTGPSWNHLENGIYTLTQIGDAGSPWILTRAQDSDVSSEVTPGMYVFVEEGTINSDCGFILATNGTITLNTTALQFVQFSGSGISHTQNTDTGTSSTTFDLAVGGAARAQIKTATPGSFEFLRVDTGARANITGGAVSSGYTNLQGELTLFTGTGAGKYTLLYSTATTGRTINLPDLAGTILLDASTIDGGTW